MFENMRLVIFFDSDLKIEDLIEKTGILNICKLNIYHEINLMLRVKNNTIPEAFVNKFEIIITQQDIVKTTSLNLKYILRLSSLQYLHVDHVSGIALLIKILITSTPLFKRRLKNHLIKIKNVTNYF